MEHQTSDQNQIPELSEIPICENHPNPNRPKIRDFKKPHCSHNPFTQGLKKRRIRIDLIGVGSSVYRGRYKVQRLCQNSCLHSTEARSWILRTPTV